MDCPPPTIPSLTSNGAHSASSSSSLQPNLLPTLPPQELIVLCGLVGSGKSNLSTSLVQLLPPTTTRRQWVRVNQDESGDRRTCEAIARSALALGHNVLIDRQNFDRAQRKVWMQLAREFEGVRVGAWLMGTSLEDCKSRLMHRQDHPTIKNAQHGIQLLNQFLKKWEEPHPNEGFNSLMILPPLPPSNAITPELLESLLSQLWAPAPTNAKRQVEINGTFGPAPIVSLWNKTTSSPYKPGPGKGQMSLASFGFARQTPPSPPPFRQ